jgi:hypothetical protein
MKNLSIVLGTILISISAQCFAQSYNPKIHYFMKGETIGGRGFQLGDPSDWSVGLEGKNGQSASGKLTVSPENYEAENDALKLVWNKKNNSASITLYGPEVDLSSVKDLVALSVDIKVDKRPTSKVNIVMDCGYPCRAEVRIDKQLRKMKTGEWTTFPVPLNCFESDNFDLTKINGPFSLSTAGKLEVSIANIRMLALPEGELGCAAN